MKLKSIVSALPVASNTGWGVAGRRITEELKKLSFCQDLNEVNGGALLKQDFPVEFNCPLIEAIRGVDLLPVYPHLYPDKNVGYSFAEEDLLLRKYALNGSHCFNVIATGSSWAARQMRIAMEGLDTRVIKAVQGVDADIFCPTDEFIPDPNLFTVLSGGKWEFRKGQDVVIRAMAVLMQRHSDVRLVASWWNPWAASADTMASSQLINHITSGFGHHIDIQKMAYQNGIPPDRVTFLGPTNHSKMPNVLNGCDAAIFVSRCEAGTNLPLMEAMSCGLPVVATTEHGHADVTGHLDEAYRVSSKPLKVSRDTGFGPMEVADWYEPNLEQTIEALEYAYQHPGRDMRNREAMEEFTWKHCAKALLEAC